MCVCVFWKLHSTVLRPNRGEKNTLGSSRLMIMTMHTSSRCDLNQRDTYIMHPDGATSSAPRIVHGNGGDGGGGCHSIPNWPKITHLLGTLS